MRQNMDKYSRRVEVEKKELARIEREIASYEKQISEVERKQGLSGVTHYEQKRLIQEKKTVA